MTFSTHEQAQADRVRETLARTDPAIVSAIESPAAWLLRRNSGWLEAHVDDVAQAAREVADELREDEPDANADSHTWVEANEKYIIERVVRNLERGAVRFEREFEGETL